MGGLSTAIRERIAEKDLTQAAIARKLGIGRQTFSRKLNGHTDFSVSELVHLAEILCTTVADLMQRAAQIAHADDVPTSDGDTIKDTRDGVVILQARHVDIGGEAA